MNINKLKQEFLQSLKNSSSVEELEELRNNYIGRKRGVVTALLKDIPKLPSEERSSAGKEINEFKSLIEEQLKIREQELARPAETVTEDLTLPGKEFRVGAIHPLTLVRRKIESIFQEMGYAVMDGPEIETDFYNFGALNFPPDHPARDTQDTLFVESKNKEPLLLRTHTSPVQIRTMMQHQPPVRILCPGRVFRKDEIDATHSSLFYQIEGLAVDENITFADLKGTLLHFLRRLFSSEVELSLRPTFFPFTEPSADVSVSCVFCNRKGCKVCKNSGWIEILGSGMVDPNVLENVGYDSEKYSGFAFGMGLERIAMLMYAIPDIRFFHQNDIRFLSQFRVVS